MMQKVFSLIFAKTIKTGACFKTTTHCIRSTVSRRDRLTMKRYTLYSCSSYCWPPEVTREDCWQASESCVWPSLLKRSTQSTRWGSSGLLSLRFKYDFCDWKVKAPKVFTHPSKSVNSGVTSCAACFCKHLWKSALLSGARFPVMGCTFCNKVSFDIPSLLKTPQWAVSGGEQQSGSDGEGQHLSHQAVGNVKHRFWST